MGSQAGTKKSYTTLICAISVVLAALATAGRLISLYCFYDKIGYFQRGAILPVISNVLYVLSLLFFAFSAFFLLPKSEPRATLKKAERIAALLPAAALAVHVLLCAKTLFEGAKIFEILDLLLAIVGVIFFVSLAFCRQPSALTAISGVGVVLWMLIVWIISYLDLNVPMNSPDKLFFHFACLGGATFVFFEVRTLYAMPRNRFYLFSMLASILMLSVSAIPSIIASFDNVFSVYTLLQYDTVFLTLAIYSLVRLVFFCAGGNIAQEQAPEEQL